MTGNPSVIVVGGGNAGLCAAVAASDAGADVTLLERAPIEDDRQFDADLRRIFSSAADAPGGEPARWFIHRHYREIVSRISYWTDEGPGVTRTLVDHLARRAAELDLRVGGLDASTLIELTAFGTAVVMNHRYTRLLGRTSRGARRPAGAA